MLKVVIDTNLLIDSEQDFYNYPSRIIDAVIAGQVEAFANRATLRENHLIAGQKIQDPNYLNKLRYFFEVVKPLEYSKKLSVVSEDSQDNKLVESALGAKADYLVTSDKHLLALGKYKGVRIVRPEEFWHIYEDRGNNLWQRWINNFIKT